MKIIQLIKNLMLVFTLCILCQGRIALAEETGKITEKDTAMNLTDTPVEESMEENQEEQSTFYVSNKKEFGKASDGNYDSYVVRDIILTEDINATDRIYSGCNMSIDLNGHSLTLPNNTGFSTNREGKIVIKSSKKGGKIFLNFTKGYQYKNPGVWNAGTFILESGTIYMKAFRAVMINNQDTGNLYIKGGAIKFSGDDSIKDVMDSSQTGIGNLGKVTMSGGKLYMSGANSYRIGIRNEKGAKVTINGGVIDIRGKYARGIHNEGTISLQKGGIYSGWMGIVQKGSLTMSGGSIKSVGNGIFLGNCKSTIMQGGEITSSKECGIFHGSGKAIPIISKGIIKGTMAIASDYNGNGYYYRTSKKGKNIKCISAKLIVK